MNTASAGHGGQQAHQRVVSGRDEADLRAQRQVAVEDTRAQFLGHQLSVSGRGDVDARYPGFLRSHETALELGAVGEIAGREDDTAAGAKLALQAVFVAAHAADAAAFGDEFVRTRVRQYLHAETPRMALQMIDVRVGIRQHGVHARLLVRRFGHRAVEAHAAVHQPAQRVRNLVAQDAAQLVVVA
jgi:hypothetical protein